MIEIQQAFENWFDKDSIGKKVFDKDQNGLYKYLIASSAFDAFKAGWEAAKQKELTK